MRHQQTTTMPAPQIRDLEGWQQTILEHRRALFEKIIEEFPSVLRTHRTKVEVYRLKLSGPKANQAGDRR
jgi:hypothetical protein